ncbi:hypothetical protein, partial [Salmonella sp. SAL4437]|uniref:hypothetical protein n=1 Tax=Salmonella sp. SAL4437 TaxID=3159892 RepID=UPI003979E7A4
MKLYDYSARGLPVVSTRWSDALADIGPPDLALADAAEDMAAAIRRVAPHDPVAVSARREWARRNA